MDEAFTDSSDLIAESVMAKKPSEGRRPGRPPKNKTGERDREALFLQITPELRSRLETYREKFEEFTPGVRISIADVVRLFIEAGLKRADDGHDPRVGGKAP